MNTKSVSSLLPEDVESLLAEAKNTIFSLGEQIRVKDAELAAKNTAVQDATNRLNQLNGEIANITAAAESRNAELSEKEVRCNQRESALDVYANALKEKEEKITKYLGIFENMKSVLSK